MASIELSAHRMVEVDDQVWNSRWAEMQIRTLPSAPSLGLERFLTTELGLVIEAALSTIPPEYFHLLPTPVDDCPVCGRNTSESNQVAADLTLRYEKIKSLGVFVWVHPECFEKLPLSDEKPPIPW